MAVKPPTIEPLEAALIIDNFADQVLAWFDIHGRKHLPWQQDINAYRVWISEIMLQQTQVATVIPYFEKFMQSFPTIETLAAAELDEVLHHWSGLGYYSRARNLHKSAQTVMHDFAGEFPQNQADIMSLPGIGQSTSGAICAIVFKQATAILDGNVKRVLARVFCVEGWPGQSKVLKKLWSVADAHTPTQRVNDYTQAMMDLGATVCTRSKPKCGECPVQSHCQAYATNSINSYPGKKPRKVLPVKSCSMLVIRHQQQVLLEQRPITGIWPGLWGFIEMPALAENEELQSNKALLQRLLQLGIPAINKAELALRFRHTFSHYHLDIQALAIDVDKKPSVAQETKHLWYDIKAPAEVGLAAPVTKILKQLN